MGDPEQAFVDELEVFRTEAESAIQFFYAYLTIRTVLGENGKALDAVNETPLFWKTSIGALQAAYFMALSRVFDQKSKHNIDRLLRMAERNIDIFSKSALAKRKRKGSPNAEEWLDDYLRGAYEPTAKDIRQLKRQVAKYRKIYENNYRAIRNEVYAHKELSQHSDIQELFGKAHDCDLAQFFVFLNRLHEALWQQLNNGRKLTLPSMPYSVKDIKERNVPKCQRHTIQERIVHETREFFDKYTMRPNQSVETEFSSKTR